MREPMGGASGATGARLVCRCMGISSTRIAAALQAEPLRDIEQVGAATGAGTVCGSCHAEIEELLAERAGRPWPEAQVRENRRAGYAASLTRVEAVLYQAIAPRLLPATDVELISLEGLQLELHLRGEDTPGVRESIAQRLRKLVCTDIAVRFG
jgi:bacterioferritin-associated ferredoxin